MGFFRLFGIFCTVLGSLNLFEQDIPSFWGWWVLGVLKVSFYLYFDLPKFFKKPHTKVSISLFFGFEEDRRGKEVFKSHPSSLSNDILFLIFFFLNSFILSFLASYFLSHIEGSDFTGPEIFNALCSE